MKGKVIIIGASTTGKTTLVKYLRDKISISVLEADEELTNMNGGTYPHDDELKMKEFAPRMVENILNLKSVVFFTNTHYFTLKDLAAARKKGFIVLQLVLARDQMKLRSERRQKLEGYEDHTKYFDDMLKYQEEISKKGMVDGVIDSSKTAEEIAKEIEAFLI